MTSSPWNSRARGMWIETSIAAALFLFAVTAFAAHNWGRPDAAGARAALLLFALLTGATLALSVEACRERLRAVRGSALARLFAVPLALALAIAVYSLAVGLPVAPRAAAFAVYLIAPAAILALQPGSHPSSVQVLAGAAVIWLPIEFSILPSLPMPPPGGFRGAPLAALANGLYLFLVASPVNRVGYTFRVRLRDLVLASAATAAFAVLAIPIGLGTGFLHWGPRVSLTSALVTPLAIYLVTAVPEEFLFRGLIQNALERWLGRAGLPIAAVIFGFAHLPDLRYVLLAAIAGLAYGWVYIRTRRISASAITHALVDWIWVLLLRG